MLSLFFKEKLPEEREILLFDELQNYFPMKIEYDIEHYDQKVSVFVKNKQAAVELSTKVRTLGFRCGARFNIDFPLFHPDFFADIEKEKPLEFAHLVEIKQRSQNMEPDVKELVVRAGRNIREQVREDRREDISQNPPVAAQLSDNSQDAKPILHRFDPPAPFSPSSPLNYVTFEQFEKLSKQIELLTAQNRQLFAAQTPTSSSAPARAPARAPASAPAPMRPIFSADFAAKNELIANGIRCEKCNVSIRGIEPIGRLMMAVREHVMTHFDSENPLLKRYECRQCPQFRTNFVDDMENHLKKHGTMVPMPQKRQELVHNLVTETHLKLICALCIACFPEVFEKIPPPINSILAVDTPAKAKASVFPSFDRVFCTKYKIPNQCNVRSSLPIKVIQL